MVTCTYPCNSGVTTNLILSNPSYQSTARSGDTIKVSVDVTDQSYLYGGSVTVDFVDTTSGNCVYTQGFSLGQGQTRTVVYQTSMPGNSLNLRISAASWIVPIPPLPMGWRCEDVKYAEIVLYGGDGNGNGSGRYACTTDKGCVSSPDGPFYSKSKCNLGCKCPENQMRLFGSCYNKNNVIIAGVVLFAVMYFKGK